MKTFYKIEEGKPQVGQGTIVPPTFVEYVIGQEPIELLEALQEEQVEQELQVKLQESKQYINDTGWIWEKYNRNVLVLKDMTSDEFNLKYSDIITKQEEYRALINELERQLEVING